jgi:hypothetical protein
MEGAQRGAQVGVVEIVCALVALAAGAASLMWDANFSGIIALIIVIVLYAVLRDVRKLWHMGGSGMHRTSAGKGAPTQWQGADGTNKRTRTTIE